MSKINDAPNWNPEGNDQPKFNRYQPYSEEVTDNTIVAFGKYKGQKMANVPADWFIWYAEEATGIKNFWLMQYIQNNWEALKKEVKR